MKLFRFDDACNTVTLRKGCMMTINRQDGRIHFKDIDGSHLFFDDGMYLQLDPPRSGASIGALMKLITALTELHFVQKEASGAPVWELYELV